MNSSPLVLLALEDLSGPSGIVFGVIVLIELVLVVVMLAGWWKCFAKAGKPGWAAIVPIYNMIVVLEIAGKPIWWVLLFFIPCVNIVISLLVFIDFSKAFGKGPAFGIGLWLLGFIFFPILGFGDARYVGVAKS